MNKNDQLIWDAIEIFRKGLPLDNSPQPKRKKNSGHPWVRCSKIEIHGVYGIALWSDFNALGAAFETLTAEEIRQKVSDGRGVWVTSCPLVKVKRQIRDFPEPLVVNSAKDVDELNSRVKNLFGLSAICVVDDDGFCVSSRILPQLDAVEWAEQMKVAHPDCRIFGQPYNTAEHDVGGVVNIFDIRYAETDAAEAKAAVRYWKDAAAEFLADINSGLRWGIPSVNTTDELVNQCIDRIIVA